MFDRDMKASLLAAIQYYPIVTIMGPRQAGKTTLAKQCFPDKSYVNLESPDIRRSALDDPRGFLAQYPQGAILDEIQNVPELLSYLQVLVDEQQQEGLFILTGSHQFSLKQAITQSLAGRTAVFHLLPLTFSELDITASIDVNTLMLKGFFPRVHVKNIPSYRAYQDYVQTYLERDVGNIIQLRDLAVFQKFLTLCAGRIGQIMNKNSLANEVGVSNKTIDQWLTVLEASFILYRLPPYFANINKRVVKSSKYYFTDTGLACFLLRIESTAQLARDPLRGQIFENMVLMECVKTRYNQGKPAQLSFYRDNQGNEVDVIFQQGRRLVPIEIKSSQTYQSQFLKGLRYFQKLLPASCEQGYLLYAGEHEQEINHNKVQHFTRAANILI